MVESTVSTIANPVLTAPWSSDPHRQRLEDRASRKGEYDGFLLEKHRLRASTVLVRICLW